MKLNKLVRLIRKATKDLPKRENETHQDKTVYLDFNRWHNCMFEGCRIMIEFGMFSLIGCTFVDCRFESVMGSPAYNIIRVNARLLEEVNK